LSALFVFAITHGWLKRSTNPCQFLPKWQETSRERVLSIEELAAIWRAAPKVNPTFASILKLLVLTGARKSEISNLRWAEIDFGKALITLPASRVKSGRSVTIPLSTAAIEILEAVPRISDTLVFFSFGWSRAKAALDAKVELAPWTIHDVRRSCRSLWIDGEHRLGLDVHLSELMLGHALPGIIGVYDKGTRLPERRRALEKWAALVLRAAGEPVGDAKIVNLR
jgi:integrase